MAGDVPVTSANRKCSALTGSARKIKDNAADWHNLMLRWDKLDEEGFNMAASIVNLRRAQGDGPGGEGAELQDACCRLEAVVDKMVAVVMKMERLVTSQRGVEELEDFQFGAEGRKVPLFHSWSTAQFGSASRALLDAVRLELRLRRGVLRDVAHAAPDLAVVVLSLWLHRPFTPPQVRLALEAMLLETGHRPL